MPLLDKLREQYGVGPVCSELHIAPSTYYHCQQQRHHPDIRHILRAFSLLRPGGVLVAVCLNGPRQQEKLLPFSDVREELPRGTFAYTDVPTMIIRLRA